MEQIGLLVQATQQIIICMHQVHQELGLLLHLEVVVQ
jgi:hypothetical protein